MEKCYMLAIRSLPAWQRGATGTTMDLSAAIMMVNLLYIIALFDMR
jgi:hypothetical protein